MKSGVFRRRAVGAGFVVAATGASLFAVVVLACGESFDGAPTEADARALEASLDPRLDVSAPLDAAVTDAAVVDDAGCSAAIPCIYEDAGGDAVFVVPVGCRTLTALAWGAGGGSGAQSAGTPGAGGAIGAEFPVTDGDTYLVHVGPRGQPTISASGGAGGTGGGTGGSEAPAKDGGGGGGGGSYSGLFTSVGQGALLLAGGGGGTGGGVLSYNGGGGGGDEGDTATGRGAKGGIRTGGGGQADGAGDGGAGGFERGGSGGNGTFCGGGGGGAGGQGGGGGAGSSASNAACTGGGGGSSYYGIDAGLVRFNLRSTITRAIPDDPTFAAFVSGSTGAAQPNHDGLVVLWCSGR